LDAVQLWEARAAGADAVLLIVRILDDAALADLLSLSRELGLSALVEVHDERELDRALEAGAEVVGVNNRDLATFRTDLAVTERLAARVPADRILVAESGIRAAADVDRMGAAGADAVLVGESLMRESDPGLAARALVGRGGPRRRPSGVSRHGGELPRRDDPGATLRVRDRQGRGAGGRGEDLRAVPPRGRSDGGGSRGRLPWGGARARLSAHADRGGG